MKNYSFSLLISSTNFIFRGVRQSQWDDNENENYGVQIAIRTP